jgi:hypothetical protein
MNVIDHISIDVSTATTNDQPQPNITDEQQDDTNTEVQATTTVKEI